MNCGEIAVEFFLDDDLQSELDPELFKITSDGQLDYFKIMQTSDKGKLGEYPIKYRVFFLEYSDLVYESPEPFIVDIVDACADAIIVEAPQGTDQGYTIL